MVVYFTLRKFNAKITVSQRCQEHACHVLSLSFLIGSSVNSRHRRSNNNSNNKREEKEMIFVVVVVVFLALLLIFHHQQIIAFLVFAAAAVVAFTALFQYLKTRGKLINQR